MGGFKSKRKETTTTSNGSDSNLFNKPIWTDPVRPNVDSRRFFHILPDVKNGELVLDEKDRIMAEEPAQWLESWFLFSGHPKGKMVRVIIDPEHLWDNPIKEWLWNTYTEDDIDPTTKFKKRQLARRRFGINVWDKTPVIQKEIGGATKIIYPNTQNDYVWEGKKLLDVPTPLNQVLILEGSEGNKNAKKPPQNTPLWTTLEDLDKESSTEDGRPLNLAEMDLKMVIRGPVRVVSKEGGYRPLTPDIYLLPRWDIQKWATPWPDDAVIALLNGADFNDVISDYRIQLYPSKYDVTGKQTDSKQIDEDDSLPF